MINLPFLSNKLCLHPKTLTVSNSPSEARPNEFFPLHSVNIYPPPEPGKNFKFTRQVCAFPGATFAHPANIIKGKTATWQRGETWLKICLHSEVFFFCLFVCFLLCFCLFVFFAVVVVVLFFFPIKPGENANANRSVTEAGCIQLWMVQRSSNGYFIHGRPDATPLWQQRVFFFFQKYRKRE